MTIIDEGHIVVPTACALLASAYAACYKAFKEGMFAKFESIPDPTESLF